MNDGHSQAVRLDGYLQAIAALRDDGTSYSCFYLGPVGPPDSLLELCRCLRLEVDGCTLQGTASAFPPAFEQWLLRRIRPMSDNDKVELDHRLATGFCEEVRDIFQGLPEWFELRRTAWNSNMGAISDVFVFGRAQASFAVHCSWDS